MLYECLVIDNSNFFKNGTIRVRLKKDVSSINMLRDLSINPIESIRDFGNQKYESFGGNREFKYDDRDVRLSTPIGGAYDYGVFILPQPNTWGIVSEIGTYDSTNTKERFVWLGALSMFNQKTKSINIPSDSLGINNGCNEGNVNLELPNSEFVFKQKETHISESSESITEDSHETLDWRNRPTQNMIVINDNKIFIMHNNRDEEGNSIGTSELTLDKNGAKINFRKIDEDGNPIDSGLVLNNNGTFNLSSNDSKNQMFNSLLSTEDSIELNHVDKQISSSLTMGDNGYDGNKICSLNFKDKSNDKIPASSITMDSKFGITITSGKHISINPGQDGIVSLGTGEGYVLTSNSPGTFNFDNHTVTAVETTKA